MHAQLFVCFVFSFFLEKQPTRKDVLPISSSFVAKSLEVFELFLKNQANRVLFGVCGGIFFLPKIQTKQYKAFRVRPRSALKVLFFFG